MREYIDGFIAGFFAGIYAEQHYSLPKLSEMMEMAKTILKDLEKPPSK